MMKTLLDNSFKCSASSPSWSAALWEEIPESLWNSKRSFPHINRTINSYSPRDGRKNQPFLIFPLGIDKILIFGEKSVFA